MVVIGARRLPPAFGKEIPRHSQPRRRFLGSGVAKSMDRYICIHGHFYQPPRENPWLEGVELQDSAYPYHDWNERINAECYAPNAASRILSGDGRILKIPNNYSQISFNFGPTLLAWLAEKSPEVYENILTADRMSQKNFSGHGSAMAQAYNHMIMPLANSRDRYTQVSWGIQDFQHRFQRLPEGMWLPETAVDLETLEFMAALGVRFTILAPHQARRVRQTGRRNWQDVSGQHIDPTRAYNLKLPSGKTIALFFYDGPISKAVAFENLLERGENLAHRLAGAFSAHRKWPQLVNIATDGETYGHHRHHADRALAYALDYIASKKLACLTNYAEYLEKHPPTSEVEIFENTSWSCAHGVERWWKDCGCHSGMHPGWSQTWRTPLRNALDWLRDTLAPLFESRAGELLKDPWAARNDYIQLILDRSPENMAQFFQRHAAREFVAEDEMTVLRLLELQRHAMLMYTSCGWFFDELSGIEAVQVMQYAGRAIQLAQEVFGNHIEDQFLERLALAPSNIPEHRDGRLIYENFVQPAKVDLREVGAHYAISSLFEDYAREDRIFCFSIKQEDYRLTEVGKAKLAVGRILVTSEITRRESDLSFSVLHFGDHNMCGGVREFQGEEAYNTMVWEVTEAFSWTEFPETIRRIDQHFGASTYSLRSLFRDEQRKVLDQIMASSLQEAYSAYRLIYHHHVPLMRFLEDLSVPLPEAYRATAEFVLNLNLREAFEAEDLERDNINNLLEEVRVLHVELDAASLEYALRQTLERLALEFRDHLARLDYLRRLDAALTLAGELPFEVNLRKVQNIYYEQLQTVYPQWRQRASQGEEGARTWVDHFVALGEKLAIQVD
jgi:alpha-amylase/alpha-mannosidase (GH57 family)